MSAARQIAEVIRAKGFSAIVSVGAGRACVEYHLKNQLPSIHLTCTELSPRVVQALRDTFSECDHVGVFDFTSAQWPSVADGTVYLLNRVDTELDDEQWKRVFGNMAQSGVRHVLVIATGFVTGKTFMGEVVRRCRAMVVGRRLTFAGYVRTKEAFRKLWVPHYVVEEERPFGNVTGFLLRGSDG